MRRNKHRTFKTCCRLYICTVSVLGMASARQGPIAVLNMHIGAPELNVRVPSGMSCRHRKIEISTCTSRGLTPHNGVFAQFSKSRSPRHPNSRCQLRKWTSNHFLATEPIERCLFVEWERICDMRTPIVVCCCDIQASFPWLFFVG